LRARAEDIEPLVNSFNVHFCAKHRRRPKIFPSAIIGLFQSLPWPGNVRQLRNLVERLVVTIPHKTVTVGDLPATFRQNAASQAVLGIAPGMTLAQVESELIRQTLLQVTSNREEAAKCLGISRRALQYKIQRYGLGALSKAKR
jgi:DNA-binding NtrC family response regulator